MGDYTTPPPLPEAAPREMRAGRRFETHALGQSVGSARLDEKASPVDGGRARVRLLHRLVPEQVGPPDCPIMLRWTLFGTSGDGWRLMLHRFPPYSDDRDPHDHPCDFWTLVLAGGYDDMVPGGDAELFYCMTCGDYFESKLAARKHLVGRRWHGIARDHAAELAVGDRMRRGSFRRRRAEHRHRTRAGSGGCWSLVLMAPKRREWGFLRSGEWFPWRIYERRFGFGMRCE